MDTNINTLHKAERNGVLKSNKFQYPDTPRYRARKWVLENVHSFDALEHLIDVTKAQIESFKRESSVEHLHFLKGYLYDLQHRHILNSGGDLYTPAEYDIDCYQGVDYNTPIINHIIEGGNEILRPMTN